MESTIKPKRTKTPEQALHSLMRLCARAEKSSGDARRLMRGWGLSPTDAEQVLQRLTSERFIDDSRYASAFVREKCHLSGWGSYKIRSALARKEIDRALIDEALSAIDPADNSHRIAEQIARKARSTKAESAYELRTKLMRYGLSRGFDFDTVSQAVDQYLKKQNQECDTFFP